jgi:hypothetical protein
VPARQSGIWIGLGMVVVAVGSLLFGMRLALPPEPTEASLGRNVAELRAALEHYRADHGWYPADPDRDFNSDGRAEVLRQQLTAFTRDDGKPASRRDAQYCFGPYLREIPADPVTGSRRILLDPDRERPLEELRADVERGSGRGGWYYEPRTGNVVANHGRGRMALYARF